MITAVFRSLAFFASNLRSGQLAATKAMLAEAVFAVFAGGLVGAISQYLRRAQPLWATALVVWAGLPAVLLLAQIALHHVIHTPHRAGGLLVSFALASLCAAFTWFAMRRGALLGGVDQTTFAHDLKCLPGITVAFVLAGPRMLATKAKHGAESC